MMKKIFSDLMKPSLEYTPLDHRLEEPIRIPDSKTVTLLHLRNDTDSASAGASRLQVGDRVKTDQRLTLFEGDSTYSMSPVTGTVASLTPVTGDFGKEYIAIRIDVDPDDIVDDQFQRLTRNPSLDVAVNFLTHVPGNPPLSVFTDPQKPINTIVVNGLDNDLFNTTNQYVLVKNSEAAANGIQVIKTITGIDNVILVIPKDFPHGFGHIGAETKAVDTAYPKAHPQMIAHDVLGKTIPAGQTCEDMGIAFFSAEAVAVIGEAFDTGRIPKIKVLTLVNKDGEGKLVSARIGTPISDVFKAANITLNNQDRIIFGGPMTGSAVYDLDQPILPDTNVIFLQDQGDIPEMDDCACVNCGECIGICPAKIPVNMLVRYLSAGQYEGAADGYDLYSCIECGLCSYVCVSRIPIFQYIRLAKYELARTRIAEETDA